MDAKEILSVIWTGLNSAAGITAIASIVLWLLNRLYAKKPLWQQFEGSIIAGVKFAEKEIPDDVENKALLRLDHALKYVVTVYEQARGRKVTNSEIAELTNGIQILHAELEATECLNNKRNDIGVTTTSG